MDCNSVSIQQGETSENSTDGNNQVEKIDSKFFNKVDDFYVLNRLSEAGKLPEWADIDGIIYKRFLDLFYIDGSLANLTEEQTLALCDIRLKFLSKITSLEYNKFIICELLQKSLKPLSAKKISKARILDFGIGSGISVDCLKSIESDVKLELVGTDISKQALKQSSRLGIETFYWRNGKHIPTDSFDGIISSFVFDFNITATEIERLHSLLKPGRRLVLNMYKKDDYNFENVQQKLIKAKFHIQNEMLIVSPNKFGIKHNCEKIIIAEKI